MRELQLKTRVPTTFFKIFGPLCMQIRPLLTLHLLRGFLSPARPESPDSLCLYMGLDESYRPHRSIHLLNSKSDPTGFRLMQNPSNVNPSLLKLWQTLLVETKVGGPAVLQDNEGQS